MPYLIISCKACSNLPSHACAARVTVVVPCVCVRACACVRACVRACVCVCEI